jgi:phage tail sheath gpL-like
MAINFIGLSANDPVPDTYVQINFGQGSSAGFGGQYDVVLLGNKLSSGSANPPSDGYIYGPAEPVSLNTEDDAIQLFGSGSELHRMFRKFVSINKTTSVYAVVVDESAGNQATQTLTITLSSGTNPAAAGTFRYYTVSDDFVDVGFSVADTTSTIASDLADNINAQTNLPFTALASTNTVTLTAKQKGTRGNWLRGFARVIGYGTNVVSSVSTSTYFSGGTVADNNTAALAVLANSGRRFYYHVSAAEDVTNLGRLKAQVDTLSLPISGVRQRFVAGSVDTLANTTTTATSLNVARGELVWLEQSEFTPAELAAYVTAAYSLIETPDLTAGKLSFTGFGNDPLTAGLWNVKAPLSGLSPSRNSIKAALNNGITPIKVEKGGRTSLVKRITTRSLNGSVSDYRTRDSHIVTVCDFFGDDLKQITAEVCARKTLQPDPAPGGKFPGPDVMCPTIYKNVVKKLINKYSNNNVLVNVEETLKSLNAADGVQIGPQNRLSVRVQLYPTPILDQIGISIDQVG